MNKETKSLSTEEIGEQSSGKEEDEIQREMLRRGKNDEAANDRDIAGSADTKDTPHGREETKNEIKENG